MLLDLTCATIAVVSVLLQGHPKPELVIMLHDNPLGQEAAGILIRVNASDNVKHIDMSRATLNEAANPDPEKLLQQDDGAESVTFDPSCPSRVYRLELSNSNHREVIVMLRPDARLHVRVYKGFRVCPEVMSSPVPQVVVMQITINPFPQVAKQLLAARMRDGAQTWRKATFNAAPLSLSHAMCQGWWESPAHAPKASEKKKKKKKKTEDSPTQLTTQMPTSGALMVRRHARLHGIQCLEGLGGLETDVSGD